MNVPKRSQNWSMQNDVGWRVRVCDGGYKIDHSCLPSYRYTAVCLGTILPSILQRLVMGIQQYTLDMILSVAGLILSIYVTSPIEFFLDLRNGQWTGLGRAYALADLKLLARYHMDKGRYELYACADVHPLKSYLIWESVDKKQIVSLLQTVFGCTLKESDIDEQNGSFKYTQAYGKELHLVTFEKRETK